ncbi:MAG TPA: hypothetical protein VEX70_02125 [Pyrinomonadaceae bacterium]|nr:hypothetical protein [Pyrinomonadaceae bacterium]
MNSKKCSQCGMVNWAEAASCKRCGATFGGVPEASAEFDSVPEAHSEGSGRPSLRKRVSFVVGAVGAFVLAGYVSLRATSEAVSFEQRRIVERAIDVLEQKDFGGRAFLLRNLVSYRTSDNWWNRTVGHGDAYAATNFPFELVTLYPDFFTVPIDDTERAVILLHESYHLAGAGEERAFAEVWREKSKLGWTKETYGETRLWRNVRHFTEQHAPQHFSCGADGADDCFE